MDMNLGNFSVSLAVKDMAAARDFYTALGFEPAGGDGQRVQIMRNGTTTIGLFHGLFERNVLTFNPGWDAEGAPLAAFTDVRELKQRLHEQGIESVTATEAAPTGPASFLIVDPDGNPILIDQHV
ncbi:VOC family protein [Actinophytocola sp.]|uniref:VOC family protein n=1 Tax=Actinophytocola sp. TaxID=1872138 RepID=UPI002D8028DA|nr:VOC family protein [Actinophytocola sp.]HET9140581.1 VOC family protein [Actinophytocola sp.]HEU5110761.1 VOC family protein [Micromonosporaceae bacterium]